MYLLVLLILIENIELVKCWCKSLGLGWGSPEILAKKMKWKHLNTTALHDVHPHTPHLLTQADQVHLLHGAEVHDPTGVFRLGHDTIQVERLPGLLHVVPLETGETELSNQTPAPRPVTDHISPLSLGQVKTAMGLRFCIVFNVGLSHDPRGMGSPLCSHHSWLTSSSKTITIFSTTLFLSLAFWQ